LNQTEERWKTEQEYFDAIEYSHLALPAATVERYRHCRKPFLAAEYPFHTLGDLTGKRVLEVGCGDGGNSILLALRGAQQVTGIEISAKAVEAARQRAAAHGLVEPHIRFIQAPLEQYLADHPNEQFDVICGWAVLHHVLPVLADVLRQLAQMSHRNTVFLFVEPVALSRGLRNLRKSLPIALEGTEDERPLERGDFKIVESVLVVTHQRYFQALGRLSRFFLGNYELGSSVNRVVYDTLCRVDRVLFNVFGLESLASQVILKARTR
jgi:2-polyprenyl-3-methyl-5-hydroxy-6-metoxy-1,4-benzoquinol methylase